MSRNYAINAEIAQISASLLPQYSLDCKGGYQHKPGAAPIATRLFDFIWLEILIRFSLTHRMIMSTKHYQQMAFFD